MSAPTALSNGLIGRTQKKITDSLYLDMKDAEYIHHELELMVVDLMREWEESKEKEGEDNTIEDFGDVHVPRTPKTNKGKEL